MQMLTARLVFCYCLYWGRFSTGELFVVELLGNEDVLRICIPCSSPPPPPGSLPVTGVAVQGPWGPAQKTAFVWMLKTFILMAVSRMCQLALKQKVKPSHSKNKSFSGTTMHWWSTLVLLSASSPVLRAWKCLSFALNFPLRRHQAASSAAEHPPKSLSPYACRWINRSCLNLKFMALHSTLWGTSLLFPACCISRIELMNMQPSRKSTLSPLIRWDLLGAGVYYE